MPDDTLPLTIIGALPHPHEEIVIDDFNDVFPEEIVGTLPSLASVHRISNTHFTPDGRIITCVCGWSTHHLCSEEAEAEWMDHLA